MNTKRANRIDNIFPLFASNTFLMHDFLSYIQINPPKAICTTSDVAQGQSSYSCEACIITISFECKCSLKRSQNDMSDVRVECRFGKICPAYNSLSVSISSQENGVIIDGKGSQRDRDCQSECGKNSNFSHAERGKEKKRKFIKSTMCTEFVCALRFSPLTTISLQRKRCARALNAATFIVISFFFPLLLSCDCQNASRTNSKHLISWLDSPRFCLLQLTANERQERRKS